MIAKHPSIARSRRFSFERDTFAFPNELVWEYQFEEGTGAMRFRRRVPPPTYAHRCFVITRAVRLFFDHATFAPDLPPLTTGGYRERLERLLQRSVLRASAPENRVVFPGFSDLRRFSQSHEGLLKARCGGAWRSYFLRSHWRMVFPISRRHQEDTAARLEAVVNAGACPVVHLVCFPSLRINHGMILYEVRRDGASLGFTAYDPNDCSGPTTIRYDGQCRQFSLPATRYWAGGPLNVIHIYRSWWM